MEKHSASVLNATNIGNDLMDSVICTPQPQASSTVDNRKLRYGLLLDDSPSTNPGNSEEGSDNKDDVKPVEFLGEQRDLVESLKKQLDEAMASLRLENSTNRRDSVTSSLGIVRLDEVEDINAAHDEEDTSDILKRLIPTEDNDLEMSWRKTRELARQSVSSRKLSLLSNGSIGDDKNCSMKIDEINSFVKPNREPSSHKFNPFDGEKCSTTSVNSDEFASGDVAVDRLLQGEAAWIKEKAEIPVEIADRSLSGIYPDDRWSSASSFLRNGSEPFGTTLGGDVDPASRPNFGWKIFSPVKVDTSKRLSSNSLLVGSQSYEQFPKDARNNEEFKNDSMLDKVPTKECSSSNKSKRGTFCVNNTAKNEINLDDSIDSKNLSVNDDRLSVSSVASITHIAELLGDMSVNASPRQIVDMMLSSGSSRNNIKLKSKAKQDDNRRSQKLISIIEEEKNEQNDIDLFKDNLNRAILESRTAGQNKLKSVVNSSSVIEVAEDSEDNGKENLNESVWMLPSKSGSLCEDKSIKNINDSAIFKIPDASKLPTKRRTDNNLNKIKYNNSILSDATNTCRIRKEGNNETCNRKMYNIESASNVVSSGKATKNDSSLNFVMTVLEPSDVDHSNISNVVNISNFKKLLQDRDVIELESSMLGTTNGRLLNISEPPSISDKSVIQLDGSVIFVNETTCNSENGKNLGDNEVEHVCIGAITKWSIPLENSTNDVNVFKISVKHIKSGNKLVDNVNKTVKLYFPVNVTLKPGTSKDIEVCMIPLVAKQIECCFEVSRRPTNSTESTVVLHSVMNVIGEYPQVVVEPVSLTKTSASGLNFGLLPEESLMKSVVKIQNTGVSRVPILLEICKLSSEFLVFYMMDKNDDDDDDAKSSDKEAEVLRKVVILDPGEIIKEMVFCFTPPLSNEGNSKVGKVSGQFLVKIATTEEHFILPPLSQFQLLAQVGQTRILIAANCNPLVIPASERKSVLIRNAGYIPVALKLHSDCPYFSIVGPHNIYLDPDQNGTISVMFLPDSQYNNEANASDNLWKGTLWLSVVTSEIRYSVDLQGQKHRGNSILTPKQGNSVGSEVTTSQTSRSSSPCSSSCSRSSDEAAPLELACTSSALVWASCPLSQMTAVNKKCCILRNKRNHREKLLLSISDPQSCYKIVEEKGSCVTETRLNLEEMESRQITVAFNPTQVGPCKAGLIITRVQHRSSGLPCPSQKKVLHLYGYGGKAVLNIKNVYRDPELRMWTYLDPTTLQTTFDIENTGDGTAFVKLGQEVAATGVSINPEQCLIAAHKSISVVLSFSPTAGRAEHLLNNPSGGDMLSVTRITITHGDEATRLRLKRLYNRLLNEKHQADGLLMERLAILNNLFPGASVSEVNTLKDKLENMKTLWLEGIRESTVGVLLERCALENAQLDSTAQFIDLATTMLDETVYCNKLAELIVAPRVISISNSQPISSFSLRNTTVLQSRFHVEIPDTALGLTVEPVCGVLPPHASCLLTVKHVSVALPNSTISFELNAPSSCTAILKVHSDLMDVLEVPVNWSTV